LLKNRSVDYASFESGNELFFPHEARLLDKMLGLNIENKLGTKMEEYLKLIENDETN